MIVKNVNLPPDEPSNANKRDRNFQGFGRFLTASTGEYLFRTVKPVVYPGRKRFVTQVFVAAEPKNSGDGVLRGIRDPKARESVIVPFEPLPGSKIGELTARFDVVLGFTPPG